MPKITHLTVGEAALRLGLSPDRVRTLIRIGVLKGKRSKRVGRGPSLYVEVDSVARLVARRRQARGRGPSPRTLARALERGVVGDVRTLIR